MSNSVSLARKTAVVLGMTVLTVAVCASVVLAIDVYLLIFLGILSAALFTKLAAGVQRLLRLPYLASLAILVSALGLMTVISIGFFGWRIEQQVQDTSQQLDQSYVEVQKWLGKHPTVKSLLGKVPIAKEFATSETEFGTSQTDSTGQNPDVETKNSRDAAAGDASQDVTESTSAGWSNISSINSMTGRVFGILGKLFATTFGMTMNMAFILFVGVFLAMKPRYYRDGLARCFPINRRERVCQILDQSGETLFNWLQGRAATMLITGVGTGIMLRLLGVPLAFTLGVITGLLTFIPNIGGILALLLSMIVAAPNGTTTMMWVVIVYAALQFVESNVITPLIQQRQTSVPPPLLLSAQLMMGVLAGFLGVLVATPLVAVAMVVVKEAYLVDVLGEER